MAGVDTDEATDSEDDGDDAIGVYLRIGIKTLNFSNFPTPGDESSDELSESEEDERAHWSTQSSGEIPVVVPSRTKDKQRVSDSDSEEDLTSSDLSDTEEDSQEEEEQLRQNEAKRLATKLQEGANFLLVTRKHGVRPSHVRLSGDQRTIICRRHTILLDSVDELREGQATAEFEIHRQPDKTHLSFSLIYNMRKAFNLIAENEEQYKTWVNTLKCLIKKQVDEESAYAERAWHALGGKSELSVEEILRLMRKLNMRPTKAYAEEMLRIVDANSDGHLQYEEFLQLLRLLRQRAELHELFDKYATDDDVLTPKQFLKFLQREQKEDMSLKQCTIIMKKFMGECKDIDITLNTLLPSAAAFGSAKRRQRFLRLLRQIFLHFPSFVKHTAKLAKEKADRHRIKKREPAYLDEAHAQETGSGGSSSSAPDGAAAEPAESAEPSPADDDHRGRSTRPDPPVGTAMKRQGSIVDFWNDWAEAKERKDRREQQEKAETDKKDKDEIVKVTMNRWQFFQYMISDHNSVFIPEKRKLYQDMKRPITDYFIASSHNTYLTGNQLKSKSATEMYVLALKQGCRCLELDCWDGKRGYPIVYHGHTLTSRVRFEDAVIAIAKYAFFSSPYPLILSLEVHCSKPQQIMMAEMMRKAFGDMLALPFADGERDSLPSPEDLKYKILLKGSPVRLQADETEQEEGQDRKSVRKAPKEKVAQELSDVLYLKSVHFDSFQQFKEEKCNRMTSLAEVRGFKLLTSAAPELVNLNRHKFTRIYPKGTRFASTNYDPVPFWNAGSQLVALNYQHVGKKMFYNHGKFLENGQCGYVLKPPVLRSDNRRRFDPRQSTHLSTSTVRRLTVQIINARQLPHVAKVVNPYAIVAVNGVEKDARAFRTKVVRNNGFDPQWNQTFDFPLTASELGIFLIAIYDKRERFAKDRLICYYSIPVECIRAGYRVMHLFDKKGKRIPMSNLLCRFSLKQSILGPNLDRMNANMNKLQSTLTLPRLPSLAWTHKK